VKASRLLSLPAYLFEDLKIRYSQAVAQGRDVIDLSIGDPDLPPPASLVANLREALDEQSYHRYPPQRGMVSLKGSIRRYLKRRCGLDVADDQILVLIGSKEGLAHLPWAVCNPNDRVIVPDPAYPVYQSAAMFAGCRVVRLGLEASNGFRPDVSALADACRSGASLCFLNYPNNPTSACVDASVFATALELGDRHGVIIANDAAYADVYFGGEPSPLLCEQPGALERRMVELFSFSKMYSVTGWRVGFAIGHREIIDALAVLKANIDSGVFGAIQDSVARTLDSDGDAYADWMRSRYEERRAAAIPSLEKLGFQCFTGYATFYLWLRVPSAEKSMDFAVRALDHANVLVTPGVGFGDGGEGYIRIALTQPVDRLEDAIHRLAGL
jgi:LL-diaminopimelate aminotransferase